jgi:hypothetical protein
METLHKLEQACEINGKEVSEPGFTGLKDYQD